MRKITVLSMITLDGVMQAPGGPKEDTSGGFAYGGWMAPFDDDVYDKIVQEELKQKTDYILGRKTFEIWADYWPEHGAFWPNINAGTKYVFSKKWKKSDKRIAGWKNSVLIPTIADIRKLKKTKGPDIQVWGSSKLVHLLMKHDLVDELRIKWHPVILGKGKNLFSTKAMPTAFTLRESIVTSKGVILAVYARSGEVMTGTMGG